MLATHARKLHTVQDIASDLGTYRHRVMAMIALAGITPVKLGRVHALDASQYQVICHLHRTTRYRGQGRPRLSDPGRN